MNRLKILIPRYGIILLVMTMMAIACKKDDHFIGGSATNPQSDLTTYDYLRQNPLFDTLVLLIDRAGMKADINGNVTFFAPTDYSIKSLLEIRTAILQAAMNDENIKYTLDSFPVNELRDSIKAYMYKGRVERKDLSLENQEYDNLVGEKFIIKMKETTDYSGIFAKPVQYMYLTKIINGIDPDPLPEQFPDEDKDNEQLLQTTGILTKTGVLHALNNNHIFYWR